MRVLMPFAATLLLAGMSRPAQANCDATERHDPLKVQLLTMSPGEAVFSAFGHSAIWVTGGGLKSGRVYNWGAFNGSQPNLVQRFLSGRLEYWLDRETFEESWERSEREDRKIVAQRLDLTDAQAVALMRALSHARKKENRHYTYHWRDANCATKIRDVLDEITDGALSPAKDIPSGLTARGEVLRHFGGNWPVWFGWNAMATAPTDLPMTSWESMFLPVRLREQVDLGRLGDDGKPARPLVAETCELRSDGLPWAPPEQPKRAPVTWIAGLAWAGLIAGGSRKAGLPRWVAGLGTATIGVIAGLLGLITMGLAGTSAFDGIGVNANWTHAHPLLLWLPFAAVGLVRRPAPGAKTRAFAKGIAAVAAVGIPMGLLLPQDNTAVMGLLAPPVLAAAWAIATPRERK